LPADTQVLVFKDITGS